MTRILIIGDTHGKWKLLSEIIYQEHKHIDVVIQVGDFGFFPTRRELEDKTYGLQDICTYGLPLYFVDGNHENHEVLQGLVDTYGNDVPINIYGDIYYVPRGCNFTLGNTNFLGIGGAMSIDKDFRTDGVDWFEDEVSCYKKSKDILQSITDADVLISHTVPTDVMENLEDQGFVIFDDKDSTCELLKEAIQLSKVRSIFCGHWHCRLEVQKESYKLDIINCIDLMYSEKVSSGIYKNNCYIIREFE